MARSDSVSNKTSVGAEKSWQSLVETSAEYQKYSSDPHPHIQVKNMGEAFLLTVGAFLLTVKLLCLQSLKALIRRTFPL